MPPNAITIIPLCKFSVCLLFYVIRNPVFEVVSGIQFKAVILNKKMHNNVKLMLFIETVCGQLSSPNNLPNNTNEKMNL